jgi:hypothetical protein
MTYYQSIGEFKVDEKTTFQILAFMKSVLEEKIANAVGEKQLLIDQKQLPTLFAMLQNAVDACQLPVSKMLSEAKNAYYVNCNVSPELTENFVKGLSKKFSRKEK